MLQMINEDISDGLIEDDAKIWCMFCNTDMSKALDAAVSQTKQMAAKELEDAEDKEDQHEGDYSEVDEALLNEAPRLKLTMPKKAASLPKTSVSRKVPVPKSAPKPGVRKAPMSKPTPKPKTAPKPKATPKPSISKPSIGQRIETATRTLKNTATIGAAGASGVGAYKVYDSFYGNGNPNEVKVDSNGAVDLKSWQDATFKDQRAAVRSGRIDLGKLPAFERWKYKFTVPRADRGWPVENIALALAAAYGLWKGKKYIWTRVKELVDRISSGKSLAICEFRSDGDDYKAVFDIKSKKWKLYYAGSTITRESSYPPRETADKFFSTKFFDRLTKTCWKHANKYLNDKAFAAVASAACGAKGMNGSSKAALKDIFKSRKQILDNLKNGKYEYI